MLPPTPIRRLLLVPLAVVIAAALAALTPAVALITVAFNLISRRARPERPRHSRLLRVAWLGLRVSAGGARAATRPPRPGPRQRVGRPAPHRAVPGPQLRGDQVVP